ncbi:molybdenum cofactor synthesi domain-containing protein [Cladophialophora immunda]|nr:molybdenum cofactor synthesi domain-containing protein [Cladophialophora immunda]
MSSPPLLRPAILVVSDTAAADPSTDKSIPILKDVFSDDGAGKWSEPLFEIVKDDVLEIQRVVRGWTDSENETTNGGVVNLVVTTGGTGFARRDFTPEAITPLIHRHAPGIVHGMLSASFQITPFAMMSRPVAGVRYKSIIITLPGSPKGAKENLQAVLKLLPHACLQAAGQDSRAAHVGGVKKLEKEAGVGPSASGGATPATSSATAGPAATTGGHDHNHHHNHDHDHSHGGGGGHGGHRIPKAHTTPSERPQLQSNDPRLGATARYRSSPYPMLNVSDAVSKILENAPSPVVEIRDVSPDLVGYVAAEDIKAAEAVPAYRASIVDGYAVIVPDKATSQSIKGVFPVASVSHAQASSLPPPLQKGQIARITTGAPLPANANAVVMVEDTVISTLTPDGKEEASVEILTDELVEGENIREPGSDIQLGQVIVAKGTQISALGGEIGVLAAAGIKTVPVHRKPRVGVMSTGDEVTDVTYDGALSGGMIRDSNRPSLLTLLRGWRMCEAVVDLGVARDTPHHELEHKLRDAFRLHELDLVVTTGGVSMGELDLLKPTVERALGGHVHFGRVNMKPGKPTTFASVPVKGSSGTSTSTSSGGRETRLIFGLPGNPASALVTANLFVLPCIQHMTGLPGEGASRVKVRVQGRVRCDKARVEYHRVLVSVDPDDGKLVARSTGMQRSSRVGSLASANGLLVLPQREGYVEDGGVCEALMVGMVLGY